MGARILGHGGRGVESTKDAVDDVTLGVVVLGEGHLQGASAVRVREGPARKGKGGAREVAPGEVVVVGATRIEGLTTEHTHGAVGIGRGDDSDGVEDAGDLRTQGREGGCREVEGSAASCEAHHAVVGSKERTFSLRDRVEEALDRDVRSREAEYDEGSTAQAVGHSRKERLGDHWGGW
jgi:hypothetical protein